MQGTETLDNKVILTLDQLSQYQNIGYKHISFSVTLACPLHCQHCIVGAGPERNNTTMPLAHAYHYAGQMAELFNSGVTSIGFTGGEPLLAPEQISIISQKAAETGMICGIVTSGYFCKDRQSVIDMVNKFPAIKHWDISVDSYHIMHVAKERIKLAYETIKSMNVEVKLRFTYHVPMSEADKELFDYLKGFCAEGDLFYQKIRKLGRAKDLEAAKLDDIHWTKPCMTQGMVVRYDGSIAPCCCSLVESRKHPFKLGSALEWSLADIHRGYMCHPLLQFIRILGFSELMRWIMDSPYYNLLPDELPNDICDLCPLLFEHLEISEFLYTKASKPQNVLRTAVGAFQFLKEKYMLEDAIDRFAGQSADLEGYALACELLKNPEKYNYYTT